MQIVLTMYYRAEYHPHKTKDMIEAQKVFKKWLENNKIKKLTLGDSLKDIHHNK